MKITCSMCTAKRMIPTDHTVRKLSYRKHKNWKTEIFENQCQTSFYIGLEWRLTNVREPSARDVARHFQRHESTISRLLNRFQQTGNVVDGPRSGRPRKTTPRKDCFLTTSSRRNRFLSSRKLARLLRNATGTGACDRTLRNRLHAARLKACRPYVAFRWRDRIIELPCLQQHNVGIFQRDNARPHTARYTQNILRIHNVACKITGSLSHWALMGPLRSSGERAPWCQQHPWSFSCRGRGMGQDPSAGHYKTDLQHETSLSGSLCCEWWAH